MNTKYFLLTGRVPAIHPAAMVLFIEFMLMSLLLKKAFCSWLCPVGTLSEHLWAQAELDRDRLQQEIADVKLLHGVSEELISAENVASVYEKILDVAVAIMHSEYASMQAFYPERGELLLLAHRGFNPEAARFWEWVDAYSTSTCA